MNSQDPNSKPAEFDITYDTGKLLSVDILDDELTQVELAGNGLVQDN